ncbi:MAG: hypothetical protein JO227_00170 [Acetobacteraceae bacterium]|nr:hypothetical protein [Acetobacteraceae bacterium]
MPLQNRIFAMATIILLAGCAISSDVMDAGNGTYFVSALAAPIRGGAAGATQVAYQDAQKYCAQKNPELHAIVLDVSDRDVYQSSFGGSWGAQGGSFGGGTAAAGKASLRFRCSS